MTSRIPFTEARFSLPSCTLHLLQELQEASVLGELLAGMDPWRTLGYTASALQGYLLRPDATLYRYVVATQSTPIGVVCVRYPWLRGAYLELLGLAAASQGQGIGHSLMQWLEEQTRLASHNVWVLVSAFNTAARAFYARQGFCAIGPLQDFVRPGFDEILLRKALSS